MKTKLESEVEIRVCLPLVASAAVAGLPITTLSESTPLAMISKTEVSGQVLEEAVKRPSH